MLAPKPRGMERRQACKRAEQGVLLVENIGEGMVEQRPKITLHRSCRSFCRSYLTVLKFIKKYSIFIGLFHYFRRSYFVAILF